MGEGGTDEEQGDLINLFFQNGESRLKTFGLAYAYTII
jgi:hypothetical protein